jgi:hypothetical protein
MGEYTESDIKYEGKCFFVIWHKARQRFEVCKKGVTHALVVGWNVNLAPCVSTAERLETYLNKV